MGKTKQNGILHRLRRGIMCGALSCALALGMMLTMPGMGMTAKAADEESIEGIKYSLRDFNSTAMVIGYEDNKIKSEIHIPAKITRPGTNKVYDVTIIYTLKFAKASKITLEEGIEEIYLEAFQGSEITEIEIPASVNRISSEVFSDCKNLTRIRFKGTMPPNFMADWLNYAGSSGGITIELPDNANMDEWKKVLISYNITNIQTYDPTASSSSSSTTSPNQEENNNGEVEFIEEEPVNRIPEHVCQYEWEVVREVGADQDGLEQYLCKLCGSVQSTLTIPASHYQVQELYTKVTGAGEGETVTYDSGMVHTVCDKLFTKLQQRKDVTLVITYQYKGESYRTTFPAGADYTELLQDADQFYGMLGLNGRCGIVTEKNQSK